jgi:hypothetical protein
VQGAGRNRDGLGHVPYLEPLQTWEC